MKPISLFRFATCLLLVLCTLMTGCIESDKALVRPNGAAPPALKGAKFINTCERGSVCLVYWVNRNSDGEVIGGQIIYRDMRIASFESLGDGRNWIAQGSSTDRKYHSYALLREHQGVWAAYDFDANKINPEYLKDLADSGGIELTESKSLLGRTKSVRFNSRPGMLRFMHDMAKLSSEQLRVIATPSAISEASSAEVQDFMRGIASSYSRSMLNNPSNDFEPTPLTISSGGCPKDLPSTIICTKYDRPPADPVAPLGPIEVLYFHRHDCSHCERIKEAVSEWQLRLPKSVAFARTMANWLPTETPTASLRAYDLNRVPALVINRKYKLELDTSDPDTVNTALGLALKLAGELKR